MVEGCDAICVLLLPNELSDRCVGVSGWMANIVGLAMMFERDLFGALSPINIIPLGWHSHRLGWSNLSSEDRAALSQMVSASFAEARDRHATGYWRQLIGSSRSRMRGSGGQPDLWCVGRWWRFDCLWYETSAGGGSDLESMHVPIKQDSWQWDGLWLLAHGLCIYMSNFVCVCKISRIPVKVFQTKEPLGFQSLSLWFM